ncbi:MAG: aspartate/glutamate racemase family protein [Devosia sp.]|nr:aspartate/glutamate racemase family protein [Devosia sp.]
MKVLLYNPNSNAALTRSLGRTLPAALRPGDSLATATAIVGSAFIGSDETIDRARADTERRLPPLVRNADAILLGCFGDLGIGLTATALGKPLISFWDAGVDAIRRGEQRTGIVTTSPFWAARLRRDLRACGIDDALVAISAILTPPAAPAEQVAADVRDAVAGFRRRDVADRVMLGGALLLALAPTLGPVALPVVDLPVWAIDMCRNALRPVE